MRIHYYYNTKNTNPHQFSIYLQRKNEETFAIREEIKAWLCDNIEKYNQGYTWYFCNDQNDLLTNIYIREESVAMAFKLAFSEYMR